MNKDTAGVTALLATHIANGAAGDIIAIREALRCLHCNRFHPRASLTVCDPESAELHFVLTGYCSGCAPAIARAAARDLGLNQYVWELGYGQAGGEGRFEGSSTDEQPTAD